MEKPKTALFKNKLSNLKINSALFVENKDIDKNVLLAAKNVPKIDDLPLVGLNVYDILRRDYLVFSSDAVTGIHERLNKWKNFQLKSCMKL